jgi:hypothetical protein
MPIFSYTIHIHHNLTPHTIRIHTHLPHTSHTHWRPSYRSPYTFLIPHTTHIHTHTITHTSQPSTTNPQQRKDKPGLHVIGGRPVNLPPKSAKELAKQRKEVCTCVYPSNVGCIDMYVCMYVCVCVCVCCVCVCQSATQFSERAGKATTMSVCCMYIWVCVRENT